MKNYIGPKNLNYKKLVEKALKQKSISTLKAELQKVFNEYIRLRDTKHENGQSYFECISCGERKDLSQIHAGHYWPVGGNEAVRFDEDNCHGQCIACNYHKHGNLVQYGGNLVSKIGQVRFDALKIKRLNRSKMMAFEVNLLIEEYKEKVKKVKS